MLPDFFPPSIAVPIHLLGHFHVFFSIFLLQPALVWSFQGCEVPCLLLGGRRQRQQQVTNRHITASLPLFL